MKLIARHHLAFILSLFSGSIYAETWTCPKESIEVYGYEFCEAEHALYKASQASIRLDKVYKNLLDKTTSKDRQILITSQQNWMESSQAYCDDLLKEHPSGRATRAEMAASCNEQQLLNRTKELEKRLGMKEQK
ncbi:MAG TPA: lysozyme inhibitor LprI family protein [Methylophilus sp.]|nr:lysozyme inhibitor LprI family protein [Methylophilus sp.]